MGDKKRWRGEPLSACSSDDDSDLLKHLDEARQRELERWNHDRWRARGLCPESGSSLTSAHAEQDGLEDAMEWSDPPRDDVTPPEVFLPLWKEALASMSREAQAREIIQQLQVAHESLWQLKRANTDDISNAKGASASGAMRTSAGSSGGAKRVSSGNSCGSEAVSDGDAVATNAAHGDASTHSTSSDASSDDQTKELHRARQLRYYTQCQAQKEDGTFDNELRAEERAAGMEHVELNRTKKLRRARQRRYYTKSQAQKEPGTFDNELSAEGRAACMERLQKDLGAEVLDECVCAACDLQVRRCESRRVEDTHLTFLKKMKKCLETDTTKLPTDLVQQYRCPACITKLAGTMVSPRGITQYTDENDYSRAWLSVCNEGDHAIQLGLLPKFAIANGFFVGRLQPMLREQTVPERMMTQLTNVSAMARVMRGGRHKCIRSHCIAFDCKPAPFASLLPRSLEEVAAYRVVLVG
ncbi:unnamed protein product [Phytophthora lilii]|uniref:Unnamed protein product n=1 Tax=Phytophthora lilii TaxID=2077276 RepID=A0A9W6TFY4_9STRA|nr:unnamed protein product [Phytophthora lilii]